MKLGFLKIESYKKGILFSSGFNFLSKASQFLQSIAIAYYFGTQATTDVFFYCYATIVLLAVFINNMDSSVLIPEAMRIREQSGDNASVEFLNFFIYLYLFIGILVCLGLYYSPVDILTSLSNFNKLVLEENISILLFVIPLFALTIFTNLLANILASYKFFTIPTMANMINNVISLLFIVFFHSVLNISSLLVGLIIAYVINILFLIYLMKKQLNWSFSFKRIELRPMVLKNISYAQLGSVTSVIVSYIPIYLLSGFASGVIASLNYGQKTSEMPTQLITYQFSAVLGIRFNELYAKNDADNLNRVFYNSTKLLLFLLIPLSLLTFLYSDNIISILYKRGAFDPSSVSSSAEFLKYFALLLPLMAINNVVSRLFMAGQKIKESFVYQIIFNFFLLIFIYIGIKGLGPIGYPIALLCLHCLNVISCFFLFRLFFPQINFGNILIAFFKILLLNGFIFIFIQYVKNIFSFSDHIISVAFGSLLYFLLLLFANWYFKLNGEVNQFLIKATNYLNFYGGRNK